MTFISFEYYGFSELVIIIWTIYIHGTDFFDPSYLYLSNFINYLKLCPWYKQFTYVGLIYIYIYIYIYMGSIPDGVIGIFHWHNPSCRTMALGSTQPLTEISTRNISWGVKAAGAYGWQPYHLQWPIVLKSGSLSLLETLGPLQPVIGLLSFIYIYIYIYIYTHTHILLLV